MADERGLRMTFDSAADLYQLARPEYPEALCEALMAATGLTVGDRLLEIGCATGKATLPLARQGFRMTCVEPGPALASRGSTELGRIPGGRGHRGRVRDVRPDDDRPVRPGVRGHGPALARPSESLPARVGAAQVRRSPRVLERRPRLPPGRGPVLRRASGGLRRVRRRHTGGCGVPPSRRAARRARGGRTQRTV